MRSTPVFKSKPTQDGINAIKIYKSVTLTLLLWTELARSIVAPNGPAYSMFVEREVRYSALFTYLVGWHVSAVSLPSSDVILAQLACPLSDIMFC
jgi:hypothetical protein